MKQKIALLEKNISELEAIRDGSVVNEESLRKELAIGDNKEQAMKNNKEQTMEENRPQVKLNKKEQVMDEEEEEDVLDLASAIEKLSVVDEEERAALTTQRRRAALQNDPVQKRLVCFASPYHCSLGYGRYHFSISKQSYSMVQKVWKSISQEK